MTHRLGIDIGGTFTDLVLLGADGAVRTRKVPSTPPNYAVAIVAGTRELLAEVELPAEEVDEVIHATTVAANAILEGKGAKTALITTRGFRDVLEMRRLRIPELYNLRYEKPPPLVPRRHRYEVDERMGPQGQVWVPLDEAAVVGLAEVIRDEAIEAVAIAYLHSYANPEHERRTAALLAPLLDEAVYLTCSAEILPEIREYERTSTAVVNAHVGPVVRRYLVSLADELSSIGVNAPLRVMQSGGGITSAAAAGETPAHMIESGPAAGVIAAARVAAQSGIGNVISFDMGGTTAKAALIEDGRPVKTSEYEIGAGINISSRLVKGGGHAVKLPFVDVSEIGAGGGSIVAVDGFGRMTVGPESAGADPGPACYGRGGVLPTLSDALVVLGFLNPSALIGGELPIDRGRAQDAIAESVASPLSIDVLDAARGIFELSIATMTRAVKAVSTYRGRDPRDFALFVFGGNGPVVGAAIATELEIARVIVPPSPGVFSALGLLLSESEYEFARAVIHDAKRPREPELAGAYAALERQAHAALAAEGIPAHAVEMTRLADIRYLGQAYELTVPVPPSLDREELARAFAAEHRRSYGHASEDPIQIVSVRVIARDASRRVPCATFRLAEADDLGESPPVIRDVCFGRGAPVPTPIIGRSALLDGPQPGPLIVEEYDATCLVPPGWTASLDPAWNITLQGH
jgi:N-methylhydantoinase A